MARARRQTRQPILNHFKMLMKQKTRENGKNLNSFQLLIMSVVIAGKRGLRRLS